MFTPRHLYSFILVLLLVAPSLMADSGEVTQDMIRQYQERLDNQPDLARIVNAATNNDIKALSLNREIIAGHDSRFNFEVEGSKIINQESSGRCWMFAGANMVTPKVMTRLKLSDFKLSEAYLAFWDKLEKSNLFLETMIEMRDRDINDRALQQYLDGPMGDGGWWQYFEGLIGKYGLVPTSAMPETEQSSKTGRLNSLLDTYLRKTTADFRRMHEDGKSVKQLREHKEKALADIYTLLVCTYGTPPTEFVFRYEDEIDDSTKVLVEKSYNPLGFYNEFYGEEMPKYVSIVDNPAMEYGKLYEFSGGRNMYERDDLLVLNLPIEKLKQYATKAIMDSQIVWFACDVGRDNYNDSGIFAVDVYDYNTTFGIDFSTTKTDRINYNGTSPNHAMALVGVDTTASGEVRKWRVENSWGSDKGNSGYWTMYDPWFDENVLMVIIDDRLLEADDAKLFDQKPIIIEDWQPFFRALTRLQ